MFGWFEKRLDPFPSSTPSVPPKTLLPFLWHYVKPAWPWLPPEPASLFDPEFLF